MDVQDHLNASVAEKEHAANGYNVEKMVKAYSDIEHSIWFKSSASTLRVVSTVLLSRLSSYLVYKKN